MIAKKLEDAGHSSAVDAIGSESLDTLRGCQRRRDHHLEGHLRGRERLLNVLYVHDVEVGVSLQCLVLATDEVDETRNAVRRRNEGSLCFGDSLKKRLVKLAYISSSKREVSSKRRWRSRKCDLYRSHSR